MIGTEFNILTFSVDETRQSACIGLHRNVSTKIKGASTYNQKRLTSGPPQVIAHSRSGAQRSGASARTNGPQHQLDHARSSNVGWPGCPRFLHKTRKTQSPRGPDPRWSGSVPLPHPAAWGGSQSRPPLSEF